MGEENGEERIIGKKTNGIANAKKNGGKKKLQRNRRNGLQKGDRESAVENKRAKAQRRFMGSRGENGRLQVGARNKRDGNAK